MFVVAVRGLRPKEKNMGRLTRDVFFSYRWRGHFVFSVPNHGADIVATVGVDLVPINELGRDWYSCTVGDEPKVRAAIRKYLKADGATQVDWRQVHLEIVEGVEKFRVQSHPTWFVDVPVVSPATLHADRFDVLMANQHQAWDIVCKGREVTRADVATYVVAMNDELLELAREIGWKTWKPVPTIDRERVLDEMADVTAFFGTWLDITRRVTGASLDEIWEHYEKKARINLERFAGRVEGYGVEQKDAADDD
jgi:hypothetical protein